MQVGSKTRILNHYLTSSCVVNGSTEQHLIIVHSGKSEAEITNNKRLRSRYWIVEANYWQTLSFARSLCNSWASCQNPKAPRPLGRRRWNLARIFYGFGGQNFWEAEFSISTPAPRRKDDQLRPGCLHHSMCVELCISLLTESANIAIALSRHADSYIMVRLYIYILLALYIGRVF